ncbi:ABC transporter permease [Cellulosimicrobium cellulans]|uniref:ABC transporter permease n=1 Tax=Cellulosimicrobium cellulans TaxID=1710 RepID=UPI0009F249A7|nr:ABC transporter permease [Cellulosimicrobium cellulans]
MAVSTTLGTTSTVERAPRRVVVTGAQVARALRRAGVLLGSLVVLVALWEWGARAYGVPLLFPGPLAVAEAFGENLADGTLGEAVGASLTRIVAGFLVGSLAGVLLGLLLGGSRVAAGLAAPLVTFFRFVPPLAWFGPVLVWFGTGESAKILLIVYTSVFVVALNTIEGTTKVPRDMVRMAGVTGASWWQRMAWVTLPASVPYIAAGARVAMGNAFMTVVSAEMLGASTGLGVMVNNGMTSTNVPDVFSAILVLGALGLLTDRLFVLLVNTVGKRFRGAGDADVA